MSVIIICDNESRSRVVRISLRVVWTKFIGESDRIKALESSVVELTATDLRYHTSAHHDWVAVNMG